MVILIVTDEVIILIYVEVHVMHGLPGCLTVVLQHVEAVAAEHLLDVRRNPLHAHDHCGQRLVAGVQKALRMELWNHKHMPLRERIYVQVGEDYVILVDLKARNLAVGDGAKDTVVSHGTLPLPGECHPAHPNEAPRTPETVQ